MPPTYEHLIGLLLGAEGDWPTAWEALTRRLGDVTEPDGTTHRFTTERVTIEPSTCATGPATTSSSTGRRTGTTTRGSG